MSTREPTHFLLPSEEKFNGSNWLEFKHVITAAIKARGMVPYLDGTLSKPAPSREGADPTPSTTYWGSLKPTEEEWTQRDAYIQGLIVLNIKNPVGHGVRMNGTAADTWGSLKEQYDVVTDLGQLEAQDKLRSIKYVDGSDLDTHFSALRNAWEVANNQGANILDKEFRMIVLGSMPRTWATIISTLLTTKTSNEVITQLTMHGKLLARLSSDVSNSNSTKALNTSTPRKPRSNEVCTNTNCGRTGHTMERCFRKGGGMEGQYPAWWKKNDSKGPTANNATTDVTPNADKHLNVTAPSQYYAFATTTTLGGGSNRLTLADTAATEHLFVDRGDFDEYTPITSRQGSTAKTGGAFKIIGTGTVRKQVELDGKPVDVCFVNALHAPDLSHNLVSLSKMDQNGYKGDFGNGEITFRDKTGKPFMKAQLRADRLYELTFTAPTVSAHTARSQNRPTDMEVWHRRLGHVGVDSIKSLKSKNLVDGLEITKNEVNGLCEDCIQGKHTRRPFDEVVTPEKEPMERAHIDLWGPAQVQSLGGKSYLMTVTDGGTSH